MMEMAKEEEKRRRKKVAGLTMLSLKNKKRLTMISKELEEAREEVNVVHSKEALKEGQQEVVSNQMLLINHKDKANSAELWPLLELLQLILLLLTLLDLSLATPLMISVEVAMMTLTLEAVVVMTWMLPTLETNSERLLTLQAKLSMKMSKPLLQTQSMKLTKKKKRKREKTTMIARRRMVLTLMSTS